MKTAMQELMEWLDDSIPETIKEKYLEKEKEQIIDAYDKGGDVNDDLQPLYGTPEEYYKTYNQNN
jgi:hypothetical protein